MRMCACVFARVQSSELCNNDLDRQLKFAVWDWDRITSHDLIGEYQVRRLRAGCPVAPQPALSRRPCARCWRRRRALSATWCIRERRARTKVEWTVACLAVVARTARHDDRMYT